MKNTLLFSIKVSRKMHIKNFPTAYERTQPNLYSPSNQKIFLISFTSERVLQSGEKVRSDIYKRQLGIFIAQPSVIITQLCQEPGIIYIIWYCRCVPPVMAVRNDGEERLRFIEV